MQPGVFYFFISYLIFLLRYLTIFYNNVSESTNTRNINNFQTDYEFLQFRKQVTKFEESWNKKNIIISIYPHMRVYVGCSTFLSCFWDSNGWNVCMFSWSSKFIEDLLLLLVKVHFSVSLSRLLVDKHR